MKRAKALTTIQIAWLAVLLACGGEPTTPQVTPPDTVPTQPEIPISGTAVPGITSYDQVITAFMRKLSRAVVNDNRTPAGQLIGDTLMLSLTVTLVDWHIYSDREPAFELLAFAEEGKQPTIPGPLVRVRLGTTIKVRLSNPLADTLVVRGFSEQNAPRSVLPGTTSELSFVARTPGTHMYWATANVRRPDGSIRRHHDSQLGGAIVIDPPGAVAEDRILVISLRNDASDSSCNPIRLSITAAASVTCCRMEPSQNAIRSSFRDHCYCSPAASPPALK